MAFAINMKKMIELKITEFFSIEEQDNENLRDPYSTNKKQTIYKGTK